MEIHNSPQSYLTTFTIGYEQTITPKFMSKYSPNSTDRRLFVSIL